MITQAHVYTWHVRPLENYRRDEKRGEQETTGSAPLDGTGSVFDHPHNANFGYMIIQVSVRLLLCEITLPFVMNEYVVEMYF